MNSKDWERGWDQGDLAGRVDEANQAVKRELGIMLLPEALARPVSAAICALGGMSVEQARKQLALMPPDPVTADVADWVLDSALAQLNAKLDSVHAWMQTAAAQVEAIGEVAHASNRH